MHASLALFVSGQEQQIFFPLFPIFGYRRNEQNEEGHRIKKQSELQLVQCAKHSQHHLQQPLSSISLTFLYPTLKSLFGPS
jgi:hypothetical protein